MWPAAALRALLRTAPRTVDLRPSPSSSSDGSSRAGIGGDLLDAARASPQGEHPDLFRGGASPFALVQQAFVGGPPGGTIAAVVVDSRDGLVERRVELAEIDTLLEAVLSGSGRLLLIEGPAGIGKTRLLRRARERAAQDGVTVLAGQGGELERHSAWSVARQLLTGVAIDGDLDEGDRRLTGAAVVAADVLGLDETGTARPATDPFAAVHGLYWHRREPGGSATGTRRGRRQPLGRSADPPLPGLSRGSGGGSRRRPGRRYQAVYRGRRPRTAAPVDGRPAGAAHDAARAERQRRGRAHPRHAGRRRDGPALQRMPARHGREPVPLARAGDGAGFGGDPVGGRSDRNGGPTRARERRPLRALAYRAPAGGSRGTCPRRGGSRCGGTATAGSCARRADAGRGDRRGRRARGCLDPRAGDSA